jgi:hypothetical protein
MESSDYISVENPCVGVCEIDESGYCVGCGRSADEIFGEAPEPAGDARPGGAAAQAPAGE